MKTKILSLSVALTLFTFGQATAASMVNSFDASYTADDQWYKSDMRGGGTASIEDLTGKGGNLENNQPLPTGAAKLTTGNSNGDKAEVAIRRAQGHYGTVGEFLSGGQFSYDFYKSSVGDLNPSAAASLKFTVFDTNTTHSDGYTTFVYEPTWNMTPGSSLGVPTDAWTNGTITGNSGVLWHTGFYGDANQAGNGSDGNTLTDWVGYFGDDLLDAYIVGLSFGVGTYNKGQTAYVDNVLFENGNGVNLAYDFEVSVVPLPAALPLYGAGLATMGFIGWRRKRKAAVSA